MLQNSEYDNIKTLQKIGGVGWVAENNDLMDVSILEEGLSVMGVVSIYQEKPIVAIGFLFGVLVKIFNPIHLYLAISPALL